MNAKSYGLIPFPNAANYTHDPIGQVLSDTASEGATNRLNEQLHYEFDRAGNLAFRTHNALVQGFAVNSLNELTANGNAGTPTVVGTTTSKATSVTVNGVAAQTYGDFTFAEGSNTLNNGANTFTIIAQNPYGLTVTNSVSVNLPASVSPQYEANGNLISDGTRVFSYDAECQLTNVFVTNTWQVGFVYDGLRRKRIERDYTWQSGSRVETNEIRYVCDGSLVLLEAPYHQLITTAFRNEYGYGQGIPNDPTTVVNIFNTVYSTLPLPK